MSERKNRYEQAMEKGIDNAFKKEQKHLRKLNKDYMDMVQAYEGDENAGDVKWTRKKLKEEQDRLNPKGKYDQEEAWGYNRDE